MTAAHNDRCDSLLGRGCDCRSPWAPDTAGSAGQDHVTDSAAPLATCRYCGHETINTHDRVCAVCAENLPSRFDRDTPDDPYGSLEWA